MRQLTGVVGAVLAVLIGGVLMAQGPQGGAPSTPARTPAPGEWRMVGSHPCIGPEGGTIACDSSASRITAIRAGRLFDSLTGQVLMRQVVLVQGERILEVGPEARVQIPAGAQVIDQSGATLLPGLVDAHTHMFNTPAASMSRERSTIIAIQNMQADLRAGFTAARDMTSHQNGFADVELRDAVNRGDVDGPRLQVSGRGIRWGAEPANPATPDSPLADVTIRSAEEGRAAVRDAVAHRVDWIKLYPGGAYSFAPNGDAQYVTTYPLPVLQAIIDEAHARGRKVACHSSAATGCSSRSRPAATPSSMATA